MFINCLDPEKESRRRHFLWLITINTLGWQWGGGRRPWHEENPVASEDFIVFLYGQKILI